LVLLITNLLAILLIQKNTIMKKFYLLYLIGIVFLCIFCEKQNESGSVTNQEAEFVPVVQKAATSLSTSNFDGVNWADARDNYVDGWLLPGGLTSSMTYAQCQTYGGKIIDGFIVNMGANTVRMPINPQTVLESWWNSYTGAIDIALVKGMKVILACWEGAAAKNGKIDDVTSFWAMWTTVTTKYAGNSNVYFEIFNEPFGYTQTEWGNICGQWLANFPTIPQGRILVGGTGYDENVTKMGADPRFSNCLLSQHIYTWWGNYKTEARWKTELQTRVGTYYNRTILTEYGATMTTGKVYTKAKNDAEICFIRGISDQIRVWGMGSCYWPGLRIGDTYSIQSLNTNTYILSTTNPSGLIRIKWGWGI
jgi:endoglucanase